MKQFFPLGGAQVSVPSPLGSGIRARVIQARGELIREKVKTKDPELLKALSSQDIDTEIGTRFPYDYMMSTLEALCRVETEGVTIQEAYDAATDSEVEAIMDFFVANVADKIPSATNKTNGSKRTKGTPRRKP